MHRCFKALGYIRGLKFALLITCFLLTIPALGHNVKLNQDSSAEATIKAQLAAHQYQLHYPLSVMRFYRKLKFKLTWIAPNTVKTHTWEAMMLLDCMVQYGLNHPDYHPEELLYESLHEMIDHPERVSMDNKTTFDIYLTDAIISFINNIHYGKLNPVYTAERVDAAVNLKFNSEGTLLAALQSRDFGGTIDNVQPQSEEYKNLKYHMRLLTGLYTSDCYEIPEASIRKMAINMERLRWIDNNDRPYILVNSAANTLRLYEPDHTYHFKLVNRKSLSSAKLIQSRFNFIKIRLNGETTFGQIALSIYNPKKLISTIVSYNGSITKNKRINVNSTIKIKVPLRLNIIYLTCEIIKGKIINYKDIYQLDEKLELALYRDDALLALEAPAIYLPFN